MKNNSLNSLVQKFSFAEMEQKIFFARQQVENMGNILSQLKSTSGSRSLNNNSSMPNSNNPGGANNMNSNNNNANGNVLGNPTPLATLVERPLSTFKQLGLHSVIKTTNLDNVCDETKIRRLGVTMQSKKQQFKEAAAQIDAGLESIRDAITANRRYISSLSHLSQFWSLSLGPSPGRPQPVLPGLSHPHIQHKVYAAQGYPPPPTIWADLKIYRCLALDGTVHGFIPIHRNGVGKVSIDPVSAHDSSSLFLHVHANKLSQDREYHKIVKQVFHSQIVDPEKDPDGWKTASAKLHEIQRQYISSHIYANISSEANALKVNPYPSSSLTPATSLHAQLPFHFTVSECSAPRIVIDIPGAPSFSIEFPEGPGSYFVIPQIHPLLSDYLSTQCLAVLFSHAQRQAPSLRPPLLVLNSLLDMNASPPAGVLDWRTSKPSILTLIVLFVHHYRLLITIRKELKILKNNPALIVKEIASNSPFKFAFKVLLKKDSRFLLEGFLRGVQFNVTLPVPPSLPPASFARLFPAAPGPAAAAQNSSSPSPLTIPLVSWYSCPTNIAIGSMAHFRAVMEQVFVWSGLYRVGNDLAENMKESERVVEKIRVIQEQEKQIISQTFQS